MRLLGRVIAALPCLPALGGILTNRRHPGAKVCAPADVSLNVSDAFWSWLNRVPGGARFSRDRNGRHIFVIYRKR